MLTKDSFKNKKILVMGLGLHGGGVSTAKFFADQGAEVTVTDLKIDDDLAPSLTALKNYKKPNSNFGFRPPFGLIVVMQRANQKNFTLEKFFTE